MNPLVSIIVPCYNQAQFLPEALQSVWEQTYENWECIIVNDGSPDDTHDVAQEWLSKDARFKYIQKENGGLSSARNLGLRNVNGSYIQFLDADDYIVNKKLELSIASVKINGNGIVISDFNMFTNDIHNLRKPFCDLKVEFFNLPRILFGWDYEFNIPIHCGFFKKEFFNNFKFPEDLKAKEDWIMWLTLFKQEQHVNFLDISLAYYRDHENGMTKNIEHMRTNSIKVIYHINQIVSEEIFVDYICSLLKKNQLMISHLNSKITNIENSKSYNFLEKFKKNPFFKFLYKITLLSESLK